MKLVKAEDYADALVEWRIRVSKKYDPLWMYAKAAIAAWRSR